MSKKFLILIPIFAVLLGAGVFLMLPIFGAKNNEGNALPRKFGLANYPSSTPAANEIQQTYVDTAGITFKYLSSVKVIDITPDDGKYYTSLSLVSTDEKVQVSIAVTDSNKKNLSDYVNTDPIDKGAKLVGATTLAGLSASQYTLGNTYLTLALDNGILYRITSANNNPESLKAYELVIDTLTFGDKPVSTGSSTGSSGGATIYEEEEVVE